MKCVCPGSFDPVTKGHVDIIARAARMFDEVLVAVLDNTSKKYMFSVPDRLKMIKDSTASFPNVRARAFKGLLVDLLREEDLRVIVRGVRGGADLEMEMQISRSNQMLFDECETIFLPASPHYANISSTIVRELIRFHANIRDFVPPAVLDYLGTV